MIRKLVAATAIALVVVVAGATPASAHTITGVSATNYRSEITFVRPSYAPALTVRLLDLGRRVRITNHGLVDVIVPGYSGEPYLRIGPRGTYENLHSPAIDLNKLRAGVAATTTPTIAPPADLNAKPVWHKRSNSTTATWRDRRTRWEGPPPAAVTADRSIAHTATRWSIRLTYGGDPILVSGRIIWEPPSSPWPWLVVALVVVAATAGCGFSRRWGMLLHAALALLISVDIVQSFASALATRDPVNLMIAKVLVGGFISTAAWIAGLLCLAPLDRKSENGLIGAVAVAIALAVYGGLSDLPILTHSQVPSAAPAVAARAAVALRIGLGFGILAAAAIVFSRNPRVRAASSNAEPNDGGTQLT